MDNPLELMAAQAQIHSLLHIPSPLKPSRWKPVSGYSIQETTLLLRLTSFDFPLSLPFLPLSSSAEWGLRDWTFRNAAYVKMFLYSMGL